MQRLVRIDVAEAGYEILVEEEGLDRSPPSMERSVEPARIEGILPDVGSQPAEGAVPQLVLVEDRHEPEGSRVDEPQLAPVVEAGYEVGVGRTSDPWFCDGEPTRHSQVGDEGITVI